MIKSREKLVLELKRLNQKLEQVGNTDRYMIYNANPFKFAWFNFIGGVFHSLGTLFGTLVVAGAIIFIVSKVDFTGTISSWMEKTMSQIKWEKVIPTPPSNFRK